MWDQRIEKLLEGFNPFGLWVSARKGEGSKHSKIGVSRSKNIFRF